jgi:2-polyprenyl-6-methoxyphenol hydroxylase-like FAD-dependent oxidoreductase
LHRWWNIRRADYLTLLAEAAERGSAEIIFDAKLKEIDVEGVHAICESGQGFSADIIIGADGMLIAPAAVYKTMTEPYRYRLDN